MTLDAQKQDELLFACSLAQALGEEWTIEPREEPDLLVHDPGGNFGLEVTEVFAGETSARAGSELKKNQALTQKIINQMRLEYERAEPDVPLYVGFVGDVDDSFTGAVVQALSHLKLRDKRTSHREQCKLNQDDRSLILNVTRLPNGWKRDRRTRPDWYSISDKIGWLEDPSDNLQKRIEQKSRRLEHYRENLCREQGADDPNSDVRLLLVSDHRWAFGMVRLETEISYDFHGFNRVYFYPFPGVPTLLKPQM